MSERKNKGLIEGECVCVGLSEKRDGVNSEGSGLKRVAEFNVVGMELILS